MFNIRTEVTKIDNINATCGITKRIECVIVKASCAGISYEIEVPSHHESEALEIVKSTLIDILKACVKNNVFLEEL